MTGLKTSIIMNTFTTAKQGSTSTKITDGIDMDDISHGRISVMSSSQNHNHHHHNDNNTTGESHPHDDCDQQRPEYTEYDAELEEEEDRHDRDGTSKSKKSNTNKNKKKSGGPQQAARGDEEIPKNSFSSSKASSSDILSEVGGGGRAAATTTSSRASVSNNSRGGNSRASVSNNSLSYYSVGREIYDDGYDDQSIDSISDKLDFQSPNVRVLARKNELKLLHNVYNHSTQTTTRRISKKMKQQQPENAGPGCVAMIQGVSGTGKSTLVKKFVEDLNTKASSSESPKPLLLSGKYEELSGVDVPFSAIVEAFSGLATTLLQDDSVGAEGSSSATTNLKDLARIQKSIHSALGSDISALTDVIPNLKPIIEADVLALDASYRGSSANKYYNNNKTAGDNKSSTSFVPPQPVRTASIQEDTTVDRNESNNNNNKNNRENAWNRLKYVFQKFTNAISTKERPVIMFLDDLQWCDPASLDLIQALLADKDLQYFMFIGAYRSDEVHHNAECNIDDEEEEDRHDKYDCDDDSFYHPLQQTLQVIETCQPIQNITLKNLTLPEMEEFISDVLKCGSHDSSFHDDDDDDGSDEAVHSKERIQGDGEPRVHPHEVDEDDEEDGLLTPELQELSEIVHRKTKGNLFFAMQVLEELHKKGVLQFSRMTFQWEWHGDDKNLNDLLVDDVVTAFSLKICSSPVLLQNALVTAAYTRSTLDCHTLKKLMEMDGTTTVKLEDLIKALDKAVVDGLLSNTMGSSNYSFGHDRIQQAAYSLIPEGTPRNDFRAVIGARLYQLGKSSPEDGGEDWMLFAAADHLNAAVQPKGTDDIMASIQLNLEVGERAAAVSAHAAASKFLGFAMQSLMLLEGNPWENHYEVTLKVYSLIAEGELHQGRFDIGRGIADQIMQETKCLDDRLQTQLAFAKALGRENMHMESLRVGKTTLRAMKQYPRSNIALVTNVVRDLIIVKRYFKKKSDDDIVGLPLMKDKRMEMAMELMSSAAYNSFYVGKMVEYLAIVLHMLRTTFKHGLCGQSGVAFTGYSLFSNNINDMDNAYRFFGVARKILEKTKAKHLEGLQLFVFAHWVAAWKDPDKEVLAIYDQAIRSSMESGDFENGMLSSTASIHHRYAFAHPLGEVDHSFLNVMEQLNTYKVDSVQRMTIEQWLPVQYLRGTATSPKVDCEELAKFGPVGDVEGDDENYRLLYGYMGRLQLGFYFGHYDFALDMLNKIGTMGDFDKAHGTNCIRLFFSSLTCCHHARVTQKKSYYKKANKFCQELRTMCKIKGLNSWHRFLLLEAHIRSSGGKSSSKAQASYDHAVAAAVKSGHIQDAGLAAQLAGEHFMRMETGVFSKVMEQARDRLVRQYFAQARECYRKWGAIALVKHLETIHGKYFDFFIGATLERDQSSKGETGSASRNYNSARRNHDDDDDDDFDSFCDLPRILEAAPAPNLKDEISVISDFSAWRDAKDFSNPHTCEGDFPTLVKEELGIN